MLGAFFRSASGTPLEDPCSCNRPVSLLNPDNGLFSNSSTLNIRSNWVIGFPHLRKPNVHTLFRNYCPASTLLGGMFLLSLLSDTQVSPIFTYLMANRF